MSLKDFVLFMIVTWGWISLTTVTVYGLLHVWLHRGCP